MKLDITKNDKLRCIAELDSTFEVGKVYPVLEINVGSLSHIRTKDSKGKLWLLTPNMGKFLLASRKGEAVFRKVDKEKEANDAANWKCECDVCGQLPTIQDFGMCAVCTFGEADSQQELINGEMGVFTKVN